MPFFLKCESCGRRIFYKRVDPRVLPVYCNDCNVTDIGWQTHWILKKRLRETGEFDHSPTSPLEIAQARAAMDAEAPTLSRQPISDRPPDDVVFVRDRARLHSFQNEARNWEKWVGGVRNPRVPLDVRAIHGLAGMLGTEAQSLGRRHPDLDVDSEEPALSLGAEVTVCYRTLRLLVLASQADRRILDLFALASLVDDPSESEMRTYAFLLLPIDRGVDMDGVDASVEFMSFFRAFHVLNEDPKEQVYRSRILGHLVSGNHAAAPVLGESAWRTAAGVRWPWRSTSQASL